MATKGLKYWKKKCWTEFSIFIRLRDARATTGTDTHALCCTCGKIYPAFGKNCGQAGHYVPGRGHEFLFDEDVVNFQCYNCNVRFKGNPIKYRAFMINKHGEEKVKQIEAKHLSGVPFKYTACDIEELYHYYKNKVKEMKNK